jgi:hypothetical protein
MDIKNDLITRLASGDPGWPEWKEFVELVASLEFEYINDEFLGEYFISGNRLTFAVSNDVAWPDWLPKYVPALYSMKADDFDMAGGYVDSFDGSQTKTGGVFAHGGNDVEMGWPLIRVTEEAYPFQMNSSGALFHINRELNILHPDFKEECLKVLDSLETFTQKNIQQALKNETWFRAYDDLDATLVD